MIAAGLLAGCGADWVTLTVRNQEMGEPMAGVFVEYGNSNSATLKQTDKTGMTSYKVTSHDSDYKIRIFSDTRAPFRLEADGQEIVVQPNNKVTKNQIDWYEFRFRDNGDDLYLHDQGKHRWPSALSEQEAYIGTYTGDSGSKGIYRIRVNREKGIVGKPELVAEAENPSFITFGRNGELYAVSESSKKVLAYTGMDEDGTLTLLNTAETGAGPCHVAYDQWCVPSNRGADTVPVLAVADYGGGSVRVWQLETGGRIGRQAASITNTHASKATSRQEHPHAHGAVFIAHLLVNTNHRAHLLVPDLGADRVYVYEAEATGVPEQTEVKLTPYATMPWIELPPGRGPRHAAYTYPRSLYVLNELSNSICVFGFDNETGRYTLIEEVSTLPAGFDGKSTAAELFVQGDTLYASNRGHDSIARFKRDRRTGRLELMECTPCGGKGPRHFSIMHNARWMLVANQQSNNIALLRIASDGALTLVPDGGVEIGAPVCVAFE